LEYGYDTLIENVVDPAHVPFAHHGVQAKRSQAVPLNVSVRPMSTPLNTPFYSGWD
jgi:phenylpropionate dioxygenase-like ring-hydroxylating dioxygenase large terminal subunit